MSHSLLRDHFRKFVSLSENDLNIICKYFKPLSVTKGEFLLTQNDICKFEGFVINGCFRIYSIDKKGNEKNLYIAIEDWWLMDIDSFMNGSPSELNIEALETSDILVISKTDKDFLYESLPITNKLFRIMSQKAVVAWQKRLIRNHCLTAKERHQHFINTYPKIVSRLSDRQIAKYLGISHEFLSKIKK